jgi:hypothetical protein
MTTHTKMLMKNIVCRLQKGSLTLQDACTYIEQCTARVGGAATMPNRLTLKNIMSQYLVTTATGGATVDDLFSTSGIANRSDSAEVQYKGCTIYLKPSQYLSIAAPAPYWKSVPEFIEGLKEGKKIGYPILYARFDERAEEWTVTGHEGRNRVEAIRRLYGDQSLVPVHFIPGSWYRNRHLNADIMQKPIRGEDQHAANVMFVKPDRIDLHSSQLH